MAAGVFTVEFHESIPNSFSRIDSDFHTMPSTFSSTMFCFSETRDKITVSFHNRTRAQPLQHMIHVLVAHSLHKLGAGEWRHGDWCCACKQARGCPYLISLAILILFDGECVFRNTFFADSLLFKILIIF